MPSNEAIVFSPTMDSGDLRITAYSLDSAGNAPWMIFDVNGESSVSFDLAQAKAFERQLSEAIAKMEK